MNKIRFLNLVTAANYRLAAVLVASSLLIFTVTAHCQPVDGNLSFDDPSILSSELQRQLKKAAPSVVVIITYDSAGIPKTSGSGFFTDNEGRILTNAAILKEAYSAEVYTNTNYYKEVAILNIDESLDLALIKVNQLNESPLSIDYEQTVKEDESVVIVGKAGYFNKTISAGTIVSISSTSDVEKLLYIKTKPTPSNLRPSRHGPVLNMNGDVIGLTTGTKSDNPYHDGKSHVASSQNFYAISLESIKSFLEENHTPVKLKAPKSRVWVKWFEHYINKYFFAALIYFYTLRPSIVVGGIIFIILLLAILNFIYTKIKSRITGK